MLSGATSNLWIAAWCCKCGEVIITKETDWNVEDERCELEGCGHNVCLVECRVREYRVVVGVEWSDMVGQEEEESDGSEGEYHDVCLEDEEGEDWLFIDEDDEWEEE